MPPHGSGVPPRTSQGSPLPCRCQRPRCTAGIPGGLWGACAEQVALPRAILRAASEATGVAGGRGRRGGGGRGWGCEHAGQVRQVKVLPGHRTYPHHFPGTPDGRPGTHPGCTANSPQPLPAPLVPRSELVPPPYPLQRHKTAPDDWTRGLGPRDDPWYTQGLPLEPGAAWGGNGGQKAALGRGREGPGAGAEAGPVLVRRKTEGRWFESEDGGPGVGAETGPVLVRRKTEGRWFDSEDDEPGAGSRGHGFAG